MPLLLTQWSYRSVALCHGCIQLECSFVLCAVLLLYHHHYIQKTSQSLLVSEISGEFCKVNSLFMFQIHICCVVYSVELYRILLCFFFVFPTTTPCVYICPITYTCVGPLMDSDQILRHLHCLVSVLLVTSWKSN